MKSQSRALAWLLGSLLAFGLASSVQAQTVGSPQSLEEKTPTPRDPRYTAPLVPPYLRDVQPDAATELLLNPESVQQRSESYPEVEDRLRDEIRTLNKLDIDGDRKYLEDRYLQQYGMDSYDYRFPYAETYEEDGWRRVQITFFLSLPITAGFTYGVMTLAKQSSGESNAFTGPQTAALAGFSILFSGLISWYDYENWIDWKQGKKEDFSFLIPEELRDEGRKRTSRASDEGQKSGSFHPVWLPPAAAPGQARFYPTPHSFDDATAGAAYALQSGSSGFAYTWRF
ncbi:MAG: hypothetical protein KDK25_05150 [Leptospiraceae bacterium]|nr:hypothetical protein [Leptospiraceae bacterium]